MSNLGGRICSIRKKGLKLTQQQLVDKLNEVNNSNITRCMLSNWENGKQLPGVYVLSALAKVLDVSVDYLINGSANAYGVKESVPVPTVDGKTQITGKYGIDKVTKFTSFDCGRNVKKICFCIDVFDNNMSGAGIFEGDIVFVSNDRPVKNGDIAAVVIDEKILLKRYYECGNDFILADEGINTKPVSYKSNKSEVIILGYASSLSRDIDSL